MESDRYNVSGGENQAVFSVRLKEQQSHEATYVIEVVAVVEVVAVCSL